MSFSVRCGGTREITRYSSDEFADFETTGPCPGCLDCTPLTAKCFVRLDAEKWPITPNAGYFNAYFPTLNVVGEVFEGHDGTFESSITDHDLSGALNVALPFDEDVIRHNSGGFPDVFTGLIDVSEMFA